MSRAPKAGSFEHLVEFVEVPLAAVVRLSPSPATEPFWSKGLSHRFNDPTPDPACSFGVLYAADQLETAFCESVIHECALFNARTSRYEVPAAEFDRALTYYAHPSLARLPLIDLSGDKLKRMGLNADLCASNRYVRSQQWSRALHDALPAAMGICYPSRQRPGHTCYAFFERSGLVRMCDRPMTSAERVRLCALFNVVPA